MSKDFSEWLKDKRAKSVEEVERQEAGVYYDPDGDSESNGMKPIFDGRMQYFKVVHKYMDNIADCIASDNFYGWLKNLQGLFLLMAPYIKDDKAKQIEDKIKEAKKNILNINPSMPMSLKMAYADGRIGDVLYDATRLLHKFGSHVLLPGNGEEIDGEFDPRKAMGD